MAVGALTVHALGLELLGGTLAGLIAAAGDEADAVLPGAERRGVERLEQLDLGADIGRLGGDELGVDDDRFAIGRVELRPLVPRFELGDGLALRVGELARRAG